MNARHAARAFFGIAMREGLRLVRQHARLASAIVRPLVWLAFFAAGLRGALGLSILPPYQTYVTYDVYIAPGLAAMMLMFHGMQASLAIVYDRETGSMRALLTAPLPRWFLLAARLLANVLAALPLVVLFLLIARLWDVRPPWLGYLAVLPALALSGLMLGALGLVLSCMVRQMENFAGVMNFVIFPVFFASSALYPLWRLEETSPVVASLARVNPFTHAVELIRFALYLQVETFSLAFVTLAFLLFFAGAVFGFDPGRGFWARRLAA